MADQESQVKKMMRRVEVLREAGEIKRLHTLETFGHHTVARHTFGAQLIAAELCRENQLSRGPVLYALLLHDTPEIDTGDVPAPTKRASPDIRAALSAMEDAFYDLHEIEFPVLSDLEMAVVKAADTLDLAFAALGEMRRGNTNPRMKMVFRNCMSYLTEQTHVAGVPEFMKYLREEFRYGV